MSFEKLEDVPVTQIGPCDLIQGDCLEILRLMPDNCVDSIVTDPPAGIRFMNADFDTPGKGIQSAENWDCFRRAENPNDVGRDNVFGRTSRTAPHSYGESDRGQFVGWLTVIAQELLRVLKPGGHAFVWALPRTSHWSAWAFEDAGFECRDILHHVFSQGMPKALNVGKALEKRGQDKTAWDGWATSIRPAIEHWHLFRKPLSEPTVVANVLKWGTGALNIEACRVPRDSSLNGGAYSGGKRPTSMSGCTGDAGGTSSIFEEGGGRLEKTDFKEPSGGWPSNFILSHDERCVCIGAGVYACIPSCPCRQLDGQSGYTKTKRIEKPSDCGGNTWGGTIQVKRGARGHTDQGGASRFFNTFQDGVTPFLYQKKPSPKEKHGAIKCTHPTVKSLDLMRFLTRLTTAPGGVVLDPFLGSGTTGLACIREGFQFIGIEKEAEYFEIAKARVEKEVADGAG